MRKVGECPSASIKAVMLVDEYCAVTIFFVFSKHSLAVITIGRPLIEWENLDEIQAVHHVLKRSLGQWFKNMGDVAQCELPTAGASN
jgi:hypothetical protein